MPLNRKQEKQRERIRRHAKTATRADRLTEMARLERGGSVTRYTSRRRAFDGNLLPVRDAKVIRHKRRMSNLIPDFIILACLTVAIVCVVALVSHLGRLSHSDTELHQVADTFTTSGSDADDTYLPPSVDFQALQQVNDEVSGWIYIPGTNVNYPIVSSPVRDKYLRRDIWGRYAVAGSIFTDNTNDADYSKDSHVVIYGHHLPSNTMFTPVSNYLTDQVFYDQHRLVYVETPDQTYVLNVIGVYKIDPMAGNEVRTQFGTEEDFQELVDSKIDGMSNGKSSDDYDRSTIGKLFTLVTCADNGTARSVVECIPISQYPTSYVQNVRENAGADSTVTVTAEDIQKAQEDSQTGQGDNEDDEEDLATKIVDLMTELLGKIGIDVSA